MVTIAMLTGPNGLLNKAVEAKIENAHGEVRERLQLETNAYLAEKLEGTYSGDLLTYLQDKGFVKEDGTTVDVGKLTDGTQTVTGNEKEPGKDVYKIEEKEVSTGSTTKLASKEIVKIAESGDSNVKKYSINYYDESENKKEIGLLIDNLKLGAESSATEATTPDTGETTPDTEEPTPSKLITFTIDGTEYTCEEGMTWQDFIDSPYNDGQEGRKKLMTYVEGTSKIDPPRYDSYKDFVYSGIYESSNKKYESVNTDNYGEALENFYER